MKSIMLSLFIAIFFSFFADGLEASSARSKYGSIELSDFTLNVSLVKWWNIYRDSKTNKVVKKTGSKGTIEIRLKEGMELSKDSYVIYDGVKYPFLGAKEKSRGFYSGRPSVKIKKLSIYTPPFEFEMVCILKDKSGEVQTIRKKISVKDMKQKRSPRRSSELILSEV